MKRFLGAAIFGLLAVLTTLSAAWWPAIGAVLMIVSLPFWLLFIVFLLRAVRP